MKHFTWQLISFVDGSNPYISKTKEDFRWIKSRYVLKKIGDNCWQATDSISYSVVGFADRNKMANFHKEYKTKQGAMRVVRKLRDNNYESVVLRKEIRDLRNNEHFDISVSEVLNVYE